MRLSRVVITVVVVVAVVLTASPVGAPTVDRASAATPSLAAVAGTNPYRGGVGIGTRAFWLGRQDAMAELSPLVEAGVTWIREDFSWAHVEPQNGQFDWSRLDNLMAATSELGMDVLGILDYSAPWASSDPSGAGNVFYPPSDFDEYAQYAGAVAARYGADGTFWAENPALTHRSLKAVEIWNEPWGWWFWKTGPNPAAYADLAKRTATAVRAEAPDLEILVPGDLLQVRTDGAIVGWIDNVMLAEPALAGLVDGYSVHAYPYPMTHGPRYERPDPRWDFRRIQVIDDTMSSLGLGKPIWITEIGWSTVQNHPDGVSQTQQAEYVRDAIVSGLDDYPAVERVFVYTWNRDNGVIGDREGHFGMRNPNGSPKPAWDALVALLALGPPSGGGSGGGASGASLTSSIVIERGGPVLAPEFQVIEGLIEVELRWQDIPDDQVRVHVDGVELTLLANGSDGSGSYTLPDTLSVTGQTVFRVCAATNSAVCSADVQIAG